MDRRGSLGVAVAVAAATLLWLPPPAAVRADATRPVHLEGWYLVLGADRLHGDGSLQRWLEVGDRHYRLHVEGRVAARPGQRVRVAGSLSGGRIDATSVEPVGPAPLHAVSGRKEVLVELVTWTKPDQVRRWTAKAQIGETDRDWYEEVSYGMASLGATVTPWMQIAEPQGCDVWAIESAADAQALAAGFDPGAYDLVMTYFPFFEDCYWAGLGEIRGGRTWINGFMDTRVTVHELGHNFGLLHSSDYVCVDPSGNLVPLSTDCAVSNDYGDPFSAMGNGLDGVGHFAPSQKKFLGWMPGRIARMSHDGDVTLAPFESDEASSPQALRIDAPFATYWVEYRQPIGVDWWMTPTVTDGVLVRINGRDSTFLLDMRNPDQWHEDAALPLRQTFTDPMGVTIRPHHGSPAGVTVSVRGLPAGRSRWSQYKLDPGHRGYNAGELAIGPENVGTLSRDWSLRYVHVSGFPIEAKGTFFLQIRDDFDRAADWSSMMAVSSETGSFKMYFRTKCNTPGWPMALAHHSVLVPGAPGCGGTTPGKLWAIDPRYNSLRWSLEPSGPITVDRGIVYGPIPTAGGNASLRAVVAGSGRGLWTAETPLDWAAARRTVPSFGAGAVYLSDGPDGIVESGGRVYASRGVFAFDASDGAALWQARCAGSGLCAFDGSTGARLWSLAPVDRIGIGEPAVGGRSLFATCADGLCAFDLGTGDLVWRTPDEIGCAAAASRGCRPVAGGGVVYAPGADGAVRAYDARSGAKLAQIQVGPSPTVILVDGTLYATSSRAVRAYRIP